MGCVSVTISLNFFFSGMDLDGKQISVAISNPPAKKGAESAKDEPRSLGGGHRDAGARGRGRSQVFISAYCFFLNIFSEGESTIDTNHVHLTRIRMMTNQSHSIATSAYCILL